MSAKIICDGCGKEAPMENFNGNWFKPSLWYERGQGKEIQSACSRKCIEIIAKKTGKTNIVSPV